MITNLFSVFDPTSSLLTNWVRMLLALPVMATSFWAIPSRTSTLFMRTLISLRREISALVGPRGIGSSIILVSVFSFILVNNFIGLFPYVFTASSHLVITLALAFPFWASFILYGWIVETLHALAHLVPLGTPAPLIPFMVLIEIISNLIRPITLSVRLAANIIAGHLLLTLLGGGASIETPIISVIVLLSQILLLILEFAVATIQSYVFMTLVTLYARE